MAETFSTYVSNGSDTLYTFSFDYIQKAFVVVQVNGVEVGFTLSGTYQVTLDEAPTTGSVVVVRRVTDTERLVTFVDGSILLADDLNLSALQATHIAAEARDLAAGTLILKPNGAFSANGRRISDVGTPTEPDDAVTLDYVQNGVTSQLSLAQTAAATATSAASAASSSAAQAATFRNTASSAASSATASANTASAAQTAAESARDAAALHETKAEEFRGQTFTARDEAYTAADASEAARVASVAARDTAVGAANTATTALSNLSVATLASRAVALASTPLAPILKLSYFENGYELVFVRDAAGTALTTADGSRWSPSNDRITPSHWGADFTGSTDASAAFASAFDFAETVHILGGLYLIDTPVEIADNDRNVVGVDRPRILLGSGCDASAAFLITGGISGTASTTLTADVEENAASSPVASTANFEQGDFFRLKSDEYSMGVSGDAGFGVRSKGEFGQIKSIAGGVVSFMHPVADTYDNTNFPVSFRRVDFVRNVSFSGIHFVGRGNVGILGNSRPDFAAGIKAEWVRGLTINDCSGANITDQLVATVNCMNVEVRHRYVMGPVSGDTSNNPMPTTRWAKGLEAISCEHVRYEGGWHLNVRRPFDLTSTSGSIISRYGWQIGCTVSDSEQVIGTHQCEYFTAIGNTGNGENGIQFRGRHCTITGNTLTVRGGSSEFFVRLGAAPETEAYAEETSIGHCTVTNNTVLGVAPIGVLVRGDCDSVTVSDNAFGKFTLMGFAVYGKSIRNLRIENNSMSTFDEANYDNASYIGAIHSSAAKPLKVLDGVTIRGLKITGATRRGICIVGTAEGEGARRILIDDIQADFIEQRPVHFNPVTGSPAGDNGNFAEPPVVGDVRTSNTPLFPSVWGMNGSPAVVTPHGIGARQTVNDPVAVVGSYTQNDNTYLAGMKVYYQDPTALGAEGVICVSSGTVGNSGPLTGSISAGSDALVINDAANAYVGACVTVIGAGAGGDLVTKIIAKTGTTCTVADLASTSVTDANVNWTAPVFKEFGAIAA